MEIDKLFETSEQDEPVLIDPVGDELAATRHDRLMLWRGAAVFLTVLAGCLLLTTVSLANRRPVVRYVRIDAIGKAVPISYSDLNYTPREGEIRKFLEDWTKFRYVRLRNTVAQTYDKSYYFMDKGLASEDMTRVFHDKTIAKVRTGEAPENDIELRSIQFLSFSKQSVQKQILARGEALIDFNRVFEGNPGTPPRKEHWQVSVTFFVNPDSVSNRTDPQYEYLNPIGVIITDFHETRVLDS